MHYAAVLAVSVGALGLGVYALRHEIGDALGNIIPHPHVPHVGNPLGTGPTNSEAAVDQGSYEVKDHTTVSCSETESLAVDTKATKNGALGDGKFDKVLFGDFGVCSNESSLEADITLTIDKVTNKVTAVKGVFPGLFVYQPRIDHTDFRNCVDINTGDKPEKREAKIADYQKKRDEGKKVGCDDGFDISQLGSGSTKLSRVVSAGYQAAQFAIELTADPYKIGAHNQEILKEREINQLKGRYPGAVVEISDPIAKSPDLILAERIKRLAPALNNDFKDYKFIINKKNQLVFHAETPEDGHSDIIISSDKVVTSNVDVLNLVLDDIRPKKPEAPTTTAPQPSTPTVTARP